MLTVHVFKCIRNLGHKNVKLCMKLPTHSFNLHPVYNVSYLLASLPHHVRIHGNAPQRERSNSVVRFLSLVLR